MKHKIELILGTERLDAKIDDIPYTMLCRYTTRSGFSNAVYQSDNNSNVVIEQDGKAAIIGLFSLEPGKIRELFDYMEATVSRKQGFDYCLNSEMRQHLRKAITMGGKYTHLSEKLTPDEVSYGAKTLSRFQDLLPMNRSLAERVRRHTVPVDHVQPKSLYPLERNTSEPAVKSASSSDRYRHNTEPAKSLPQGWNWLEFQDGHGGLQAPDGHLSFMYEWPTNLQCKEFEYLEHIAGPWKTFNGTLDEFKQQAESIVNTAVLHRKDSLDQTIRTSRAQEADRPFVHKERSMDTDLNR